MKRIVSVWFPNWPLTAWLKRNPRFDRRASPFALVETVKGARRLAAVDCAAEAAGLWPGKKLADSMAIVPDLRIADYAPEADGRLLMRLAHACERFSPAVAVDAPDGLMLDVSGGGHLWGGEAGLLEALAARLERWGAPARLGLADTAGAAWAAARFGPGVLPPGTEAQYLAALPVEALRLAPAVAASLRRLGLTTVGAVRDLPRAQLTQRFGAELLLRLDQATGRAEEALLYRRAPTPWLERRGLVEPVSTLEDLVRVLGDLAEALCQRLAAAGQGGRRFEAAFHRLDGRVIPVRIGTALPSRAARPLVKLFAPKLEGVDPGFGIEAVTLRADRVEPLADRQGQLSSSPDEADGLTALIDRLGNRLGEDRVWRGAPHESHVPERAVARRPPVAPSTAGWDPDRPRPVRLLGRPEPITVLAEIPDDPPAVFTWRGRRRRVRRAEGPERIAEEWWRDPTAEPDPGRVRDYYAVEDVDGDRFWLFRDGLYGGARDSRWFLHGLFG